MAQLILNLKKLAEEAVDAEVKRRDLVEVVRCKNCIHKVKADPSHPDCDYCKRLICGTITPDFFCADGLRETKDDK